MTIATDSDLLRRAATAMRERATRATPGPWRYDPDLTPDGSYRHGVILSDHPSAAGSWDALVVEGSSGGDQERHNLTHIAAMGNPAVALAVAAWLDTGANRYSCVDREPMYAVARAYLGEEAANDGP